MKFGVNTFIWTGNFDKSHIPLLAEIKAHGFDGAELPCSIRRPSRRRICAADWSRMAWNAPSARC